MKLRALAVVAMLYSGTASSNATDFLLGDNNVDGLINAINDANFNNQDDSQNAIQLNYDIA